MKKILIIDDNENDRLLIKRKISSAGIQCEISATATGEDGINIAEKNNPDIVLIDTKLPNINGFDVCRKLKEKYGDSIKIIMMTGLIDAVDAVEARRAGADDYSVKTSNVRNLIEKITPFL